MGGDAAKKTLKANQDYLKYHWYSVIGTNVRPLSHHHFGIDWTSVDCTRALPSCAGSLWRVSNRHEVGHLLWLALVGLRMLPLHV